MNAPISHPEQARLGLDAHAPHKRLAPELEVKPLEDGGQKPRFVVYHPGRDTTCILGEAELKVARLFDGRRSLEEVCACALAQHRIRLSTEHLKRFEERLSRLRLLEGGEATPESRDPFSGTAEGRVRGTLFLRLFSCNPDPALDRLLARCPFLGTRGFFYVCAALVAAALAVLARQGTTFFREAAAILHGSSYLLLFGIVGLQGVFHEGGHALSCKAFGVRVREVGLALHFFLLTAWTWPEQRAWGRLPKRQRFATILLGPFGSIVFGALGVLLWAFCRDSGITARLGLLAAISTPIGTIPTMLPIFNGDGYLLLTEHFEQPGLRSRAFTYLRERMAGKLHTTLDAREKRLYIAVGVGTLLGLAVVWLAVLGLFVYLTARELAV